MYEQAVIFNKLTITSFSFSAVCNNKHSVDQNLIFECGGDGGDDLVAKPAPEL